jgi:hypothetical protein
MTNLLSCFIELFKIPGGFIQEGREVMLRGDVA